jgi:glycerate-2-kinase
VTFSYPFEPIPPEDPGAAGKDPLVRHAYQGAVTSADAYRGLRQVVRFDQHVLRLGNRFVARDRYREIAFVALGNAATSMSLGLVQALGERVTQGFIAGPEEPPAEVPFRFLPLRPNSFGAAASTEICSSVLELAQGLGAHDLLLVLLSAGALEALALPPSGLSGGAWSEWLASLQHAGATGGEIALLARIYGSGAVGGVLARAAGEADVETLIVDRGDGPARVGGGPTILPSDAERGEAQLVLDRLHAFPQGTVRTGLPPIGELPRPAPLPTTVQRPVVIAQPSDALRGAAEAIAERKWVPRLGSLALNDPPEAAASAFLTQVEAAVQAIGDPPGTSDQRGLIVLSGTTLGVPEGVDERAAFGAFLRTAAQRMRRRGTVIALLRTAGAPDDPLGPPGRLVAAVEGDGRPGPFVYRSLRMRSGITDVGCIAVAVIPFRGTE